MGNRIEEIDNETRELCGKVARGEATSTDHYALQFLIAERAKLMRPVYFKSRKT